MPKYIALKAEPKMPVRNKRYKCIEMIDDGTSLQSLVDFADDHGITYESIYFVDDSEHDTNGYFGCSSEFSFQHCGLEPESNFNKRIADYKAKQAKYKLWYDANQGLIEKELAHRAARDAELAHQKKVKEENKGLKAEEKERKLYERLKKKFE